MVTHSFAVIFDVDGVLIDSYRAHFASWQRFAAELDSDFTEQQFAATFGRRSDEVIAEQWPSPELTSTRMAQLVRRKELIFREQIHDAFPAMPGATQLIRDLAAANFCLAVGSSAPAENVRLVLERVDPDGCIRTVVTGNDVTRGKPDPQVFQLGAQGMSVPPQFCVVVEDAPAGIVAAHAAGMQCVALASTGRTPEQLSQADLTVRSLDELTPARFEAVIRNARVDE